MEAWKISLIVIDIIIAPIIIYFGRKIILRKKLIKKQYKVDEIISDGVISDFPKKILLENINTDDNASIITLSIKNKINDINIKCVSCNVIFHIKDHEENTGTPIKYQYECPNCKFKYFSKTFIDDTRNNEIVLIIDKKD